MPQVARRGHLVDLFKSGYCRATSQLWLLWFVTAFSYYGIVLLSTEILEKHVACGACKSEKCFYFPFNALNSYPPIRLLHDTFVFIRTICSCSNTKLEDIITCYCFYFVLLIVECLLICECLATFDFGLYFQLQPVLWKR